MAMLDRADTRLQGPEASVQACQQLLSRLCSKVPGPWQAAHLASARRACACDAGGSPLLRSALAYSCSAPARSPLPSNTCALAGITCRSPGGVARRWQDGLLQPRAAQRACMQLLCACQATLALKHLHTAGTEGVQKPACWTQGATGCGLMWQAAPSSMDCAPAPALWQHYHKRTRLPAYLSRHPV